MNAMDTHCEGCGSKFELLRGRGYKRRVMCYTCQPIGGERKITYRNKHFKSKYGITLSQYQWLYGKQGGECAACNSSINFTGGHMSKGAERDLKDPCVDHCHVSGVVRGLLCFHCNTALGHVFDDVERLKKLSAYLLKSQAGDT